MSDRATPGRAGTRLGRPLRRRARRASDPRGTRASATTEKAEPPPLERCARRERAPAHRPRDAARRTGCRKRSRARRGRRETAPPARRDPASRAMRRIPAPSAASSPRRRRTRRCDPSAAMRRAVAARNPRATSSSANTASSGRKRRRTAAWRQPCRAHARRTWSRPAARCLPVGIVARILRENGEPGEISPRSACQCRTASAPRKEHLAGCVRIRADRYDMRCLYTGIAVAIAAQAMFACEAVAETPGSPRAAAMHTAQAQAEATQPQAEVAQAPLAELLARAEALSGSGRLLEAYELLAGAEDAHIGVIEFDYALGRAALDAGRPDKATLAFSRVLALDPVHAGALIDTVPAYLALGELGRASDTFRSLLAFDPPPALRAQLQTYLAQAEPRKEEAASFPTGLSHQGFLAA